MGGTCLLKIHGDLSVVGGRLVIETKEGTELMTVTSGNGGFKIEDRRDGTHSILSRNGSTFFLYGKVEIGRKVPRARVKPNMVNTRAVVSSETEDGAILGTLQNWQLLSVSRLLFRRRNLYVRANQGADMVLLIALQFCYLAIRES